MASLQAGCDAFAWADGIFLPTFLLILLVTGGRGSIRGGMRGPASLSGGCGLRSGHLVLFKWDK